MVLPSNVSFGTVIGRFMRAVADGPDEGRDPDGIPIEGLTIRFIPSADRFKNTSAVPPVTIVADAITATTDADGFVVGPDGLRGIRLLATDDEDLDPSGWTWGVAISGTGFRTLSFSFVLPSDAIVDLSTVVPVPGSPGKALQDWVAAVEATQAAQEATQAAAVSAVSASVVASAAAERAEAVPVTNDGIMAAALDIPGGQFAGKLGATIGASPVIQPRARAQAAIRRANPSAASRVALPGWFEWQDAPINIIRAGQSYVTDFDVSVFKNTGPGIVYMDNASGSNTNDGSTEGLAVQSFWRAVDMVPAGGTIRILDTGIVFRDTGGWATKKIQKSMNIVAPKGVTLACASVLAYSLVPGRAYTHQASRTNVKTVVDIKAGTSFGVVGGVSYTKMNSVAEVEATPGSWWTDGPNVYVHTFAGSAPVTDQHLALLSVQGLQIETAATTDASVYIEGVTVVGGFGTGNIRADAKSGAIDLYMKDCAFLWSNDPLFNSVHVQGARRVFSQNVTAAHSRKDGFNYSHLDSASGAHPDCRFIEVGCRGFDHGHDAPASPNTNNATTAHGGVKGIRIQGTYYDTNGTPVADVQAGTQTVNYSCTAWGSDAAGTYNAAFTAQQAGTIMGLYDCIGFGTTYDVYAATGTKIYADSTEYTSTGGSGAIIMTNPI